MSRHFVALAICIPLLAAGVRATAQTDRLPSWNAGATKKAIVEFVEATTDKSSPKFVPPEERIATFDQDGTLWVSHPMYTQVVYCLDRVPAVVRAKPELAKVEPLKTVLSGNRAAMAKFTMADLEKILAATLTGMSVDEFTADAKTWLETARDPRWKRPYTELTYRPMIQLLGYLRNSGYRTYIVTGGGQDFVRAYSEEVYGIPPEQVVGTAGATKYGYGKDGKPFLTKEPKLLLNDDNAGKPEGIHPSDDRTASLCRVRQLDRRPADARVHDGRRRRATRDARAARRREARVRLWPGPGVARYLDRHLSAVALRRGEDKGLDRHQHAERLEAHLRLR
jgi:phosphoglycolate phosphatase-like HAD superfamily hydrolase